VNGPSTPTVSGAGGRGAAPATLLHVGEYVARVRPWPGEPGAVQLVTVDQSSPPVEVVRRWLDELTEAGVRTVRTGALGPTVTEPYLENGFGVRQELALLHHDLSGVRGRVVPCESLMLRRGRNADLVAAAHLDGRAFGPLWAMDVTGIADARVATPHHRFRIAADGVDVVGFAVSGRAGRHGYLQRLAVDPAQQGRGIGRALTMDALRWARRHRCASVLVNTHVENEVALGLYDALGFRRMSYGLVVLERVLP